MAKNKNSVTKPVVKSFNCPHCGAVLTIKAVGLSVSVSCKSCHSLIDVNDPNYKILQVSAEKRKVVPVIPIGQRGVLGGNVYECIGFMERGELPYTWREYLLFNPYVGFTWLFEYDGHWSLVKRIRKLPQGRRNAQYYRGQTYKLFSHTAAQVLYVEGEFYWRVKVGETSTIEDYISPPFILSKEKANSEVIWTLGRYMEPERITKAFNLNPLTMPYEIGVGANQPSPTKQIFKTRFKISLIFAFICFIVFIYTNSRNKDSRVFSQIYNHSKPLEEFNTPSFEIAEDNRNLLIKVHSIVHNSWIYLDALLVNDESGKGIPLPIEVSYYVGSDWSEGSQNSSRMEFNVPKGTYHLNIKPFADGGKSEITYTLELINDVSLNGTFFFVLVLLFVAPAFSLFQSVYFESKRWGNSVEIPD